MGLCDVVTVFPIPTASQAGSHCSSAGRPHRPSRDTPTKRWLPTPTASEATKGSPHARDSKGHPKLTATAISLLPTPLTGGNRKSRHAILRQRCGPGLEQVVDIIAGTMPKELTSWTEAPRSWTGANTPAIRHWELVLGRPAPPPTEPGTTGRPRLAPRFVEWMMGLTEGWVTDPDLGLSRNAQLRALGNGVVPQQAATAITLMLPDLATISAPTDTLGHAA